MQLKFALLAVALVGSSTATPVQELTKAPACAADECFSCLKGKPSIAKAVSSFCTGYIHYHSVTKTTTVQSTSVITSTITSTVIPNSATTTATTTVTDEPTTVSPTCSTVTDSTQSPFPTSVFFVSQGTPAASGNMKRAEPTILPLLRTGCGSGLPFTKRISSACSCFLGPMKTVTSTATSVTTTTTVVTTTTTQMTPTATVTITATAEGTTVTDCQTATTTTTNYANGGACGVAPTAAAYTTGGRISCTAPAPAGQTNVRFRIEGTSEGPDGTIFDGCIFSGPEDVTTPSGGTHQCNGQNNNVNDGQNRPGSTLTTDIADAGRQDGFDFDGTYESSNQDFFITRIANTQQSGNAYWGVLTDNVFTDYGGCEVENSDGVESLWAFDAFTGGRLFLDLPSQYATVQPGQSVTLQIDAVDPSSGNVTPASGATFAGTNSDANGSVTFTAPTMEGCYQYKATASNSNPSQAFYLSVIGGL